MNNKGSRLLRRATSPAIEVDPQVLRRRTRRDLLLFGAGAVAALVGGGSLLPQNTLSRLGCVEIWTLPGRSGF